MLSFVKVAAQAQRSVIPQPVNIVFAARPPVQLTAATNVVFTDERLRPSAHFLTDYVRRYFHIEMSVNARKARRSIMLQAGPLREHLNADAYTLVVSDSGIIVRGVSPAAVFYGIQSLIQLLPVASDGATTNGLTIPQCTITDYPRFGYRGMHLDVARHFFPVSFVKQYIDYLALHKMNYFHWHLTDDQGWRIPIRKYPLLTSVGGYRNGTITGHHPGTGNDNTPYGGAYTRDEIREVVRYAAERYITVVPEIELPGHASAAIAAYPQLSCFPDSATVIPGPTSVAGDQRRKKKVQETWGVFEDVFCPSEYTFSFLNDVLDEVMALFPSPYIHIGGDECPKDAWKKSAFCQALMKREGLKDEHELQHYFISRIGKHVAAKGRRIIGWDEILEGGAPVPGAVIMSWRGEEGGVAAAKAKHHAIMTPGGYLYFDHAQAANDDSLTIGGNTDYRKVYRYRPVPATLSGNEARYIMGAQANLWTEYIASPARVEYQIFPRMSALSEVLWSQAGMLDLHDFERRLPAQFARYRLWGARFNPGFLKYDK